MASPLAVREADAHAERERQPLAVYEPEALAERESDAPPLAEPLPDGLLVELSDDDPQPLDEAVTELQGLSVGLRVLHALEVKELEAHAEREPDA